MNKIKSTSLDIEKLNIDKLKELFPSVVTEGKIDFDMLRTILGDEIDDSKEKYQFTWHGKTKAIKLAQSPSIATLRPDKKSSKDWHSTENLYIEGDNLEVLKQLQKTYYGKIKMIYIDPPYNTGRDFIYKDNYKDNIRNYLEQSSQINQSNPDTSGSFHSKWLNMIYPRLLLAKNLLKDDGVIFISIDDNEIDNLSKICSEIFGEDNFICKFIWKSKLGKVGTTSTISTTHEYILCYAKNSSYTKFKMIKNETEGRKENLRQWGVADRREDRPSMYYPITIDGVVVYPIKEDGTEGRWRVGESMAKDLLAEGVLELSEKNGKYNIYRNFPSGVSFTPYDTLLLDDVGTTAKGAAMLKILDLGKVFDFSKPVELVKHFAYLSTTENDIIIDFFSGSATTAQAVIQLNMEDNANRKFIMVQLPEVIDEKTEAYKAGYKNICEVGKERIRRAGEQIKDEWEKEHPSDALFSNDDKFTTDIGFKVFKLDSTNIQPWDSEIELSENKLFDYTEVFKPDRSKEDILYEIMLKYGVFDMHAEEVVINGKTMYRVGKRYMIVCLEDEITSEDVKAIAELSPRSVVFKESGFKNDNDKINAEYNLEKAGVEDIKCI